MIKLTRIKYFTTPNIAPSQRFTHPKDTASIAFVKIAATRVNISGTAIHIIMKAITFAIVIDSVTVGHNFSAKDKYNIFAASSPTIKPAIDADCFKKPFIKPITAPAPIIIRITMSIVVILRKTKTETRSI